MSGPRRRLVCSAIFGSTVVGGSAFALSPPSYMIFFPFGESAISTDGEYTINYVMNDFRRKRDGHVMIVGHTDAAEASVPLSMSRALAAKMRLIAVGIPPDRISVIARGDKGLLVQTPPGARDPQNRRVEFAIQ